MKNKIIITLGRQFGSGGREIARRLAEKLKIPVYDRELIELAEKESGLSGKIVEKMDEIASNKFFFSRLGVYNFNDNMAAYTQLSMSEKVFVSQAEIIKKLAEKSCIIVGRCADYILDGNESVVKVFVHMPIKDRTVRVSSIEGVPIESAENYISKIDKKRSTYYNYYTNLRWGDVNNYDVTINSNIGFDNAVEVICKYLELKD